MFRVSDLFRFRLILLTGEATPMMGDLCSTHACPLTFWFKPVSIFGLLWITVFIRCSLTLAMTKTLAPYRIDATSAAPLPRGLALTLVAHGYVVNRASD